ncbi:MAG: hypothetical protein HQL53_04730 [Magnetococcales bacterium]|nr:hypothetical protein [Magnetococcales bacterium]
MATTSAAHLAGWPATPPVQIDGHRVGAIRAADPVAAARRCPDPASSKCPISVHVHIMQADIWPDLLIST